MEHKGIQDWVTTFVKATNLSGLVCFDFLVDNNDNAYCIECNPRLHSAIVSFESQTKVIVENIMYRYLLNSMPDQKKMQHKHLNHIKITCYLKQFIARFSEKNMLKPE